MLNKIIGCILLVIAGLIFNAYSVHQAKVETKAAIELEYKARVTEVQSQADATTATLKEKLEKVQDEKQTQVTSANAKYNALLASLRKQSSSTNSENPSSVSSDPEVTRGNNEERFPRGTSERLAAEAYRAEVIRADLLSCYKQYDEVREAFETFRKLP